MRLAAVSRRAIAACLTAALLAPAAPASSQQISDPRLTPYGQSRWQINQQRAMAYQQQSAARVPLIAEAMRIVHEAYPNQPTMWQRAFAVIGRAGDPVRTAQSFVRNTPLEMDGHNPNDPFYKRMLAHEQREHEREAALGRAFGIIQAAHLKDDALVRRGGILIQQSQDPVAVAKSYVASASLGTMATVEPEKPKVEVKGDQPIASIPEPAVKPVIQAKAVIPTPTDSKPTQEPAATSEQLAAARSENEKALQDALNWSTSSKGDTAPPTQASPPIGKPESADPTRGSDGKFIATLDGSGYTQAQIDAMPDWQRASFMTDKGTSKEWNISDKEKERRQVAEMQAAAAKAAGISLRDKVAQDSRGADYGEHVNLETGTAYGSHAAVPSQSADTSAPSFGQILGGLAILGLAYAVTHPDKGHHTAQPSSQPDNSSQDYGPSAYDQLKEIDDQEAERAARAREQEQRDEDEARMRESQREAAEENERLRMETYGNNNE